MGGIINDIADLVKMTIYGSYSVYKDLTTKLKEIINEELPQEMKAQADVALVNMDNAKKDYDTAKALYDSLPAGPEKDMAKQNMAKAKTNFEDAKKALASISKQKDELVKTVSAIIIKAIKSLKADLIQSPDKTDFNITKQQVIEELDAEIGSASSADIGSFYDKGGFDEHIAVENLTPGLLGFSKKIKGYNSQKQLIKIVQYIFALNSFYTDKEKVEQQMNKVKPLKDAHCLNTRLNKIPFHNYNNIHLNN